MSADQETRKKRWWNAGVISAAVIILFTLYIVFFTDTPFPFTSDGRDPVLGNSLRESISESMPFAIKKAETPRE
ncbi:MAG: hypothetical protein LBC56_01295 [Oscillospiraceae bacterium]|nr:hypothetical protein [Oscillospiraceae bacterium]